VAIMASANVAMRVVMVSPCAELKGKGSGLSPSLTPKT
jgi:hypothetical protein